MIPSRSRRVVAQDRVDGGPSASVAREGVVAAGGVDVLMGEQVRYGVEWHPVVE